MTSGDAAGADTDRRDAPAPELAPERATRELLARVRVRVAERVEAEDDGRPATDDLQRTAVALDELLRSLLGLLRADGGALLLADTDDRLAVAVRAGDLPSGALDTPLSATHPLAARILDADALTLPDLTPETAAAHGLADTGLDGYGALCAAPMRAFAGDVVGALLLLFRAPRVLEPAELETARGAARQAAEMVERTRLHAEARTLAERERRHGDRLRMLADAALEMSRESDVEEILRLVTDAACRIVGTRHGVTSRLQDGETEAGTSARLVAPLVARDGGNLGLIQLSDKVDGTEFTAEDEATVVQLAQMASVSIENAELIQRERGARRAAEESARLRGALSDASAAFAASLDLEEVLSAVTSIVVPEYADWCGVNLLRSDGEIQLVAEAGADEALIHAMSAIRERMRPSLDRPHGVGAVIRTGQSEFFPAVPEDVLREVAVSAGVDPQLLFDLRIESGIVVPLLARGRPMGALTLIRSANPVHYTEDELAFAEDLASRAALAIENATRFTLERQAADMLQRSLLPQALPRLPGVQAAARYLPGGSGTRIGGDWYDVIALDEHRQAFVVGDVMGRGIPAATVMGQLRSAVRAYAQEGHEPARLLDLVDRLVERMDDLQLTTCLYAVYDSRDGSLVLAAAGHPPPLLLREDGSAEYLDPPDGLPLGTASFASAPREQRVFALPPGCTLLLYTDGLVEARDCPVDEGMRRLREAAIGMVQDPESLCDALLKAMGRDGHHDDDTALLALTVTGAEEVVRADDPTPAHRLGSDLRSPGEARRIVADTMAAWGMEDSDAVVLLTHELVTNAVLHAGEPIELRLEHHDGLVRVEVADGSVAPPTVRHYEEDSFTGRGLALVEALAGRWGWRLADVGKVVWCEVAT